MRVKIEEGNKISVEKIRFSGNKHISSSDLRGAMDNTSERKWWKFWDKARFNKEDGEPAREQFGSFSLFLKAAVHFIQCRL